LKPKKVENKISYNIFVPKDDNLYRFYHDLEKYRCSYFEYPNANKQRGTARSIGVKMKPLVEKKYIIPPISRTNSGDSITGIMLRRETKVKSTKKAKGKMFQFLR